MHLNHLDFEQPIAELRAKIEELRMVGSDNELNISDEIAKLDNGTKQVDSVLLTPIPLTKENVMKVVDDGFYTKEQVEGK